MLFDATIIVSREKVMEYLNNLLSQYNIHTTYYILVHAQYNTFIR